MAFRWPLPTRHAAHPRVGVDIGHSAVKIVRAEGRGGQLRVLGTAVESVAEPTPAAHTTALQRALTAAGVKETEVRLAIAGQDVMTRHLTLPVMTDAELDGAIRFEGETYIPFPLNEVMLDRQILEKLDNNKMRVLLVAGKRDHIQQRLAWIGECGLRPVLMDVDALAVVNAFLADHAEAPPSKTTAFVHIGARYTNVAVLQRGTSCCFTRDLTIAGNDLTAKIAEQLSVSVPEAEQLKCHPGDKEAEVTRSMRAALELLVSELRLSFDFYESQFEGGIEQVVCSGGTSLVPMLPPFVKEQLGVPVDVWAPQQWLTRGGSAVAKDVASRLAVCVGLVVRESL